MELAFEKWHGCQNDFILIHLSKFHGQTVKDSLQRQATALCSEVVVTSVRMVLFLLNPQSKKRQLD